MKNWKSYFISGVTMAAITVGIAAGSSKASAEIFEGNELLTYSVYSSQEGWSHSMFYDISGTSGVAVHKIGSKMEKLYASVNRAFLPAVAMGYKVYTTENQWSGYVSNGKILDVEGQQIEAIQFEILDFGYPKHKFQAIAFMEDSQLPAYSETQGKESIEQLLVGEPGTGKILREFSLLVD